MIFLRKSAEPQFLIDGKSGWTTELLAGNDAALVARRYASTPIKTAIISETHGKCAYCESKPLHVTYGDVEHIVPKKVTPGLAFEWSNLTLACDICNTKKGIREDIFDPYTHDPVHHFWFAGPLIFNTAMASDEAKITLLALRLDRAELFERRSEKLRNLQRQLQVISSTPNQALRVLLIAELIDSATKDEAEFGGCGRAFIALLKQTGQL